MIHYLLKRDILKINQLTITEHGGNFVLPSNLLNENSLDYLLEAVSSEIFGSPLYPEIYPKAAFYMFSIISNHIFQDGNKRTGLEAARLFLILNNYQFQSSLVQLSHENEKLVPLNGNSSNEILYEFTIEMASGLIDLETAQDWFKLNVELIN